VYKTKQEVKCETQGRRKESSSSSRNRNRNRNRNSSSTSRKGQWPKRPPRICHIHTLNVSVVMRKDIIQHQKNVHYIRKNRKQRCEVKNAFFLNLYGRDGFPEYPGEDVNVGEKADNLEEGNDEDLGNSNVGEKADNLEEGNDEDLGNSGNQATKNADATSGEQHAAENADESEDSNRDEQKAEQQAAENTGVEVEEKKGDATSESEENEDKKGDATYELEESEDNKGDAIYELEENEDKKGDATSESEDMDESTVPLNRKKDSNKGEATSDSEDSQAGKLEKSRREAVLSQIQQADRVNNRLAKSLKDPLEAGDIARVEDVKTHRKALVMVVKAIRRKNVKSGIVYYRYKVCSKYGHVEKTFDRRQLLHDSNLTGAVLGIDVNKEGFLTKMSIAEVIAHQDKIGFLIVCRCKKGDCAKSANCVCKRNGKLCTSKCHGGRGANSMCTLCEHE
jgi:hypothetical protein